MILEKLKALSDLNRLRVVNALRTGELCACQITELLGVAGATVSRHVKLLIDAGLVDSRKDGKWVYYSLTENGADRKILEFIFEQLENNKTIISDQDRIFSIRACDKSVLCSKMGKC